MKKINLGCGLKQEKGYINCDSRADVNPDRVFDITNSFPFIDNSIDEVRAISVFEHISKWEKGNVFHECHRVLKKDGHLIISIPNMLELSNNLLTLNKEELFINFIYGEQDYKENQHKWGWTPTTIEEDLKIAGFKKIYVNPKFNHRYNGEMFIKAKK